MNEPSVHHPGDPQRAFAELASLTLADHSLETVLSRVATSAQQVLAPACEVSVTLLERDLPRTAAFTGLLALALDERQYALGSGPCLDGAAAGAMVDLSDTADDARWPLFCATAREMGVRAVLTVPVPVQREVTAALNLYAREVDAFDEDCRHLAATFASYAGVALANMHLYAAQERVAEQLQLAMRSRAAIDQAKGILMAERRCSAEDAFALLVTMSQHSNRKLREIAEELVERAAHGHAPDRVLPPPAPR